MSLGFIPTTGLRVATRIDEMVVADVNGDGRSDVVVASQLPSGPSLTVLLGDGRGGFTAGTSVPAQLPGSQTSSMASGDWNGDGNADLAITSYSSDFSNSANAVSILLGSGSGQFGNPITTPLNPFIRPRGFSTADFNRDGKLDIALQSGQVLLGNGAGGFGSPIAFPKTYELEPIAAGDFNGDGIPDLGVIAPNCRPNAYRCYDDLKGTVLLGNGTGQFTPAQDSTFTAANRYAVADFNGDGIADLAAIRPADFPGSAEVQIRLGSGNGNFSSALAYRLDGLSQFIFDQLGVGDFNQDGLPDLVAAQSGNQFLYLLFNTRTGVDRFLEKPQQVDFSAETRGSVNLDLATGNFVIRAAIPISGRVLGKPKAIGTPLNDRIRGDGQNNGLQGYTGDDRLVGLGGNDQLIGGDGNDVLIGNEGSDTFVFTRELDYPRGVIGRFNRAIGVDQILDFDPAQDRILLDRETFLGISRRVNFDRVDTLAEAKQSRSYIVYIQQTGRLYYNENQAAAGFGKGGLFADLRDGLKLSDANLQSR